MSVTSLPSPSIKEEKRHFQMHRNLLRDVISKQAGSLDKAVIEAVMNLIEAGASKGNIILDHNSLKITDDGRGFETKDEILESFEVFGKSDERKKIAGRWAEFQMGRGQLMAFGKTTYRTNQFEMIVDIFSPSSDLDYILRSDLEVIEGCKVSVEFYSPIEPSDLYEIMERVRRNLAYLDVPIYLNGELVSKNPSEIIWDSETSDAYIKFKSDKNDGYTRIYNLGIYVCSHYLGLSADVVSKKKLALNFARNEVLSSCPTWKNVKAAIKKINHDQFKLKINPRSWESSEIMERYLMGEYSIADLKNVKLFVDTNSRKWSVREIYSRGWKQISFAEKGSYLADQAIASGLCLMLDKEEMNYRLNTDRRGGNNVFSNMEKIIVSYRDFENYNYTILYPHFETVYEQLKADDKMLTPVNKYSLREKLIIATLGRFNSHKSFRGDSRSRSKERKIFIGESDAAEAWTDGSSYIAIEKRFLKANSTSVNGWVQILLTLAHEYAHIDEPCDTHDHEFYERYYKISHQTTQHIREILYDYRKRCERHKIIAPQNLIIGGSKN